MPGDGAKRRLDARQEERKERVSNTPALGGKARGGGTPVAGDHGGGGVGGWRRSLESSGGAGTCRRLLESSGGAGRWRRPLDLGVETRREDLGVQARRSSWRRAGWAPPPFVETGGTTLGWFRSRTDKHAVPMASDVEDTGSELGQQFFASGTDRSISTECQDQPNGG